MQTLSTYRVNDAPSRVEDSTSRPNRFWDRHAKGYAKWPVADEATYLKKLKVTQDYLKPDMEVLELGVFFFFFFSSTACLGDMMSPWRFILPIGRILGLLPLVTFFTKDELAGTLADSGFRIFLQLQPGKGKAVFIAATKA